MDDIDDFFDFSKPFNRVVISGGYCNATVVEDKTIFNKMPEREKMGKEYATKFVKDEETQLINAFMDEAGPSTSRTSNLEDVDDDASMADEDEEYTKTLKAKEMMLPLFQRYNFTMKDSKLPIRSSKHEIMDKIRANAVVVLQGETGSGKTTQVPQYILEDAFERKEYCNIVVTQPRKIAAMSIAARVSEERKCEVGSLVGYKIGLKEKIGPDTRLTFVTTGVLLQSLITAKTMATYTHVILDEIHEREVNMDFLLIVIRRLLATNSTKTKIILMSATIDAKGFSEYFKIPKKSGYLSAPVISVDKTRLYTIQHFYFDDLEKLKTDFMIDYEEPGISDQMYNVAAKLVVVCHRLEAIDQEAKMLEGKPAVLIFLPGINEIERMEDALYRMIDSIQDPNMRPKFLILKLHSMMPAEEQAAVFRKAGPGQRKVILSTNIAESSITIKDIKFVIDFCLHRMLFTDTLTNFSTLRTEWASKSNCIQRAGRAGRMMNGRVYRLVDRRFFETQMSSSVSPEILRCPLETVVLKSKLLEMGPPHSILALAMNPPDLSDIRNTVLILKEVGGLLRTVKGNYEQLDGDLTLLGRIMAKMPLDIHITKLIVLGHIFSIQEEAIIIGAGMNVKNIFINNNSVRNYTQKMYWADGSGSDGIAILNAYTAWKSRLEQAGDSGDMPSWTRRMSLDLKCLQDMAELIREIHDRLNNVGLKSVAGPNRVVWNAREKTVILKVIMAGAFYPNYFIPMSVGGKELMERQSFTELGGRDPCNTVFFTGFDHERYIGPLYTTQIKRIISENDPSKHQAMKVMFDRTTNRIFVTFLGTTDERDNTRSFMPGKVHTDVYRAIKLRKIGNRRNLEIQTMRQRDAIEYATRMKLGKWEDANGWVPRRKVIRNAHLTVVPPIFRKNVICQVTHIVHPNKFYVRPEDARNKDIFTDIHRALNAHQLFPFDQEAIFSQGQMVAAPLQQGSDQYGRAVLKSFKNLRNTGDVLWSVFFIDYGHTASLSEREFRQMDGRLEQFKDLPPRAFEATLSEIQPSAIISPQGIWMAEPIQIFKRMCLGKVFMTEIYSVVDKIASVTLQAGDNLPVNVELIRLKFAQYAEESYISKLDHDHRVRKQREMDLDENLRMEVYRTAEAQQVLYEEDELEDVYPPEDKLRGRVVLSGPHSPLETSASATIRASVMKPVGIENNSVNSILLDSNPQDTHEKLLVASYVNEQGNRLVLRNTSLMPNIPGFGALMALIFCPTAELKKDEDGTRVITILCGLGYDKSSGESVYPEHDMALALDVVISEDDITHINALRYTMDSILHTGGDQATPKFSDVSIEQLKLKVKQYIIKILEGERKFLEVRNAPNDFTWTNDLNQTAGSSSSKKMKGEHNIYASAAIFPLLEPLNLCPVSAEQMNDLKQHSRELHKLALTDVHLPRNGITCQLCNNTLETLPQLRIHLYSKLHRDREAQVQARYQR